MHIAHSFSVCLSAEYFLIGKFLIETYSILEVITTGKNTLLAGFGPPNRYMPRMIKGRHKHPRIPKAKIKTHPITNTTIGKQSHTIDIIRYIISSNEACGVSQVEGVSCSLKKTKAPKSTRNDRVLCHISKELFPSTHYNSI